MVLISCTDDIRETSQKRFMSMVKDKEVYRIAIVNNKWVEIHLTPNALASDKYQAYFSDKMQHKRPQFKFKITSEQVLRDDLLKLNPTLPITSEKRNLFESNS